MTIVDARSASIIERRASTPALQRGLQRRATPAFQRSNEPTSGTIARLAWHSLQEELATFPKPGLVSLVDRGSHDDMDATTFAASAQALRSYFRTVAALGRVHASFAALRGAGMAAEARMLHVTRGANTHRGAIFMLGLLAAAAGWRGALRVGLDDVVRDAWSEALQSHRRDETSHGAMASRRHGAGGAIAEAIAGFPNVFHTALPAYRRALAAGVCNDDARVDAFFTSMATLADTNLLHRGGERGLADAQRLASEFMAAGGVRATGWRAHALDIHREFCERRLSPGGSADVLAAALFVHGTG